MSIPCRIGVEWLDFGESPKLQPDPAYPTGIDLDACPKGWPGRKVDLPYPAKRIGAYVVTCSTCQQRFRITTAGRADDPRSVTIPCRAIMVPAEGRA